MNPKKQMTTRECRSCGWVNLVPVKPTKKGRQRFKCDHCKRELSAKLVNVATIAEQTVEGRPSKWSDKEQRAKRRNRARRDGVLLPEVQTNVDGTAWA